MWSDKRLTNLMSLSSTRFSCWITGLFLSMGSVQAQEAGLLYSITGNGLPDTSYLYGTMHLIPAEHFKIDETLQQALEKSEGVVLEIDISDMSNPSWMQYLQLPEGKNLQQYTTDSIYAVLAKYFVDSIGVTLDQFNGFKPFFVQQMLMARNMPTDMKSYDYYFYEWSHQQNKRIHALETVEEQINFLDQIPYEEQVNWLLESITNQAETDSLLFKMIEAYSNKDLLSLHRLMMKSSPEFEQYAHLLITERNIKWVTLLPEWLKQQSLFIAVGAGHLPGENGLIQLLTKAGYSLTPMDTKP